MTNEPAASDTWEYFSAINQRRRAVRDFDGAPLPDDDVRAVLEAATLAPSSGNLQPYQLHWVRDPEQKRLVAAACEAQRAALSASTLIVVVANPRLGQRTLALQGEYVARAPALDAKAKAYHGAQLRRFRVFLRIAPLLLWQPFAQLLALVDPLYSLLPIGPSGIRNWAARSGIYAAQTLLLAAAARQLDSCPMEGFNAGRVRKALGLARGSVIPIVIALGRRRADARVEPRWRRPVSEVVVEH
jgi:nitroreductase